MALAEQIDWHCPQTCLRLGLDGCGELLAENERLKVENRDLRRVFEQATAAFREKEAEIQRLKEEAEVLRRKCRDCGALFFPNGEGERPNGYIGPVAVAAAGYLRYVVKMPFEAVRKIFAGLWGLEITPASLVGFEKQLAATGRPFYEQIADMVKYSLELNIDETSWSEGPLLKWLWTFVARDQVLFKIASSRSGDVIRDVLGQVYNGVPGSDCFSAYNRACPKATKAQSIKVHNVIAAQI